MEHKTFSSLVELKTKDNGEVTAIFSQLNVIDHDGDVTVPGAFTNDEKVKISAYNHSSWGPALPAGKGSIHADGDFAYAELQFFMSTATGKETFQTVKEMGDQQEWSYGYDILQSDFGEFDGKTVQYLRKLKVHEVSPVLLGAGIGTRTLSAKSKDMADDELQAHAIEICLALEKRGLAPLPPVLAAAVSVKSPGLTEHQANVLRIVAAEQGIALGG
jgi:hypothetical protein